MRKYAILFYITFLIFICSSCFSEEKLEKIYGKEENAIYINLVPLSIGQVNGNYERIFDNKISLMVGLGAVNGFYDMSFDNNWSVLTILYKVGVGIYPSGRYGYTLRGFYFMPSYTGIAMNLKYKPENKTAIIQGALVGLDIGYKWVFKNKVMLDFSVGMGYRTEIEAKVENYEASRLEPKVGTTHLGLQFGYAW